MSKDNPFQKQKEQEEKEAKEREQAQREQGERVYEFTDDTNREVNSKYLQYLLNLDKYSPLTLQSHEQKLIHGFL